ncbi:uncharacterized protein LOC131330084 isoform X2 [Rhododendron vialii]|uniref:uncharacterized protein LOC131330084 isoform X2 n=1 Tax=Rhododendron vialii TaxID=182163 RepID=UPI00265FBA62|nr:uncharacterized protein LOC131330084 isoform X2 [Rhododendron vialii]
MANGSCKDLPDECWELILNKLHQRRHSHLESPSLSCKRFLSIANALRTHFAITDPALIGPLSNLFHRFPRLSSLDRLIIDVAESSDFDLIETLNLSGTELPLLGLKILGFRMKNLKALNFSHLRTLGDVHLEVIADSMPCLKDLDISFPLHGGSATDRGIEVLSSKVKGN